MKPAIVADEMFPEGAGPYMDLEEVNITSHFRFFFKDIKFFKGWWL